MKYVKQFMLITLVSFLGEILRYYIPLPIPGSIYGLLIMLLLLFSGVVRLESVKGVSSFLLEIMPLMFIPPAVGIIASWGEAKSMLIPLFVISLITTLLVFFVSGKVTDVLLGGKDDE